MKQTWYTRETCRLCDSPVSLVLGLKPSPLANNYTERPVEQAIYPLNLMQCVACEHVQLGVVVDPAILYSNYRYKSGVSNSFTNHLTDMAREISGMQPRGRVLEIGSNDGTLLKAFEAMGHKTLGVDPAGSYRAVKEFFCADMVPEIVDSCGHADIIVANNVLAHIDDLRDVIRGVNALLSPDGIFVMEVQYLQDLIEGQRFDLIYHEHLDYHHLKPLKKFLESEGLYIFHVTRNASQGGSLRLFCTKTRVLVPVAVESMIDAEDIDVSRLKVPANPVAGLKGIVAAYGACAKTTGLICQTGARFDVLFDDTPGKHGMYAPTGQQIVTPEEVSVDHVYIAAWNFSDEVRARHPELPYVGTARNRPPRAEVHSDVREAGAQA